MGKKKLPVTKAKWRAQCPLCQKTIKVGDEIAPHPSKNVSRWVHARHVRPLDRPKVSEQLTLF